VVASISFSFSVSSKEKLECVTVYIIYNYLFLNRVDVYHVKCEGDYSNTDYQIFAFH